MLQDPSKLLGVPVNAHPEVIKKAHKKLVRENHPDLFGNTPEANARMSEINAAYDALIKGEAIDTRQNTTPDQSTRPWRGQDFGQQSTSRPRSPFGAKRAQEEAATAAQKEAAERARQEKAWTQDQERMAQRAAAGKDDLKKAEEAASEDMSPAERRAAQMRALRQQRQTRNSGPTYYDPRAEQAKQAYAQTQNMSAGQPGIEVFGSFSRKTLSTVTTDQKTDRALEAKLEEMRTNEARNAVKNRRSGAETAQPGAFHKAQKMTIEDGMLHIHLGSRGLTGRNIIVAPTFTKSGNNIRMGKDVQAFAMTLQKDGKQQHQGAESILMKDGDMKIKVHFSDQRENLRATSRETQR